MGRNHTKITLAQPSSIRVHPEHGTTEGSVAIQSIHQLCTRALTVLAVLSGSNVVIGTDDQCRSESSTCKGVCSEWMRQSEEGITSPYKFPCFDLPQTARVRRGIAQLCKPQGSPTVLVFRLPIVCAVLTVVPVTVVVFAVLHSKHHPWCHCWPCRLSRTHRRCTRGVPWPTPLLQHLE